ncbi:hypothetical protein HF313_15490 [Massilia atriviolacea]|uniref:Uncharacterized protein n=1 Tax=Massilia atriviolacea TaxID=2495579 RepID=A0A430HC45_9BURK|nr:hypothetical protein [Massilia atriviolacea]RSZ55069.1 hypothetical protein EJB06_31435 [Massilia atriviolacea]
MSIEIFSEALKEKVLTVLEDHSFVRESIRFEEQDDGQSLSIYIPLDNYSGDVSAQALLAMSKKLDVILPPRPDDYSWYALFTQAGQIVQCFFGGDLSSPNSGL